LAEKKNKLSPDMGFYDWKEYVDESYLDLVTTNPIDIIKYPIGFLNEALTGISRSELVLIGADTGIGKTELANSIAFHNAKMGKRVYLFSLEGDKYEVVNRERYKRYVAMVMLTNKDKQSHERFVKIVPYKQFILNDFNFKVDIPLEILELDKLMSLEYKNLKIYSREDDLNIKTFCTHLEMISDDADLVIIDHLHYFDFLSNNEHAEITEIMKKIKKLQNKLRIPIVIVSHLRKKQNDRIFPDNNDFHGSSNIPKQADTCIILSHIGTDDEDYENQISRGVYKTGMRITKSRTGMSQRIIGVVDYNLFERRYSDNYELYICLPHDVKPLDRDKYPKWAKKPEDVTKFSKQNSKNVRDSQGGMF